MRAESQSDAVRIPDLARPILPLSLRVANATLGPFARALVRLDADDLCAAARRASGLSDFGGDAFREPLRVLLSALERDADLSAIGRLSARRLVVGLLTTRLRLSRLLDAHPEIEDEPLDAPIVVMGLPRTGTTHLHALLASDPSLRALPYWESLEPIPAEIPTRRPAPGPPAADPRYRSCERALRLLHWAMPLFPLMHEMSADAPHEEIQLLAVDFSTMLFEASYTVPAYRDWYRRTDQTPAYRTLRRLLQALQWMDGRPRRWVLKSPQHLEQIAALLAVFPDAKIVQTHRDATRVTASFTTMAAYGLRMGTRRVDTAKVGAYWSERIEAMLRASVDDRWRIPKDQIHDLRFHDFMGRELESVEAIYAFAGQPFDAAVKDALAATQRANPRGRHGTIDYRLEDVGIDAAERRRALAFYAERFGLADE